MKQLVEEEKNIQESNLSHTTPSHLLT